MTSTTTNPRPVAGPGARENDRLGSSITPDTIAPHLQLQVHRLISRFGMPAPVAKTVAALAYETTGRRA